MCNRKGILVVSYGSSYKESREKSIGEIEGAIAKAFPEYRVYRAFTSEPIIERIKKKDGVETDTISQAFERMMTDGIREITIIQTHLVKGVRYEALTETVKAYQKDFDNINIAEPILTVQKNVEAFADVLEMIGVSYDDGKTAICYVGHGIEETSSVVYDQLQKVLNLRGCQHYYIGTLSVKPTLQDIKQVIVETGCYRRVVILPLMLVSGYHVRKDLIGRKSDSWKNTFLQEGFEVECVTKGLGEFSEIQNIFAEHLKSVML